MLRIYFFVEEKKNQEGKGGKYLEKENIFLAEVKKNWKGKGGKYMEKENRFLAEKEEEEKKKKEKENRLVPNGSDKKRDI